MEMPNNLANIIQTSHNTFCSDEILYRRDTYMVTLVRDENTGNLTLYLSHHTKSNRTKVNHVARRPLWLKFTLARLDERVVSRYPQPPGTDVVYRNRSFWRRARQGGEEGTWRRKRRGRVMGRVRGWSRKRDATTRSGRRGIDDDGGSDSGRGGGVVRVSPAPRQLYLNAVSGRESRGVAKQRACHKRRRYRG